MSYSKLMLLTGAGFTKNMGGFLGSEMWAKIFNYPALQQDDELRSHMMRDMNFEHTYHRIMKYDFSEEQRAIIHKAVLKAYGEMHDTVFHVEGAVVGFNVYLVSEWLKYLFCEGVEGKALWFTLNQDLFFERWFRGWRVQTPGATPFPLDAYPRGQGADGKAEHLDQVFDESHFVTLNPEVNLSTIEEQIKNGPPASYIKIHGSYGWKSSNGQESMVLGMEKEGRIANEPLLQNYLDLFRKAIKEGDKRLLISGYGFQDPHINGVLANGAIHHGLKIFILRPSDPKVFKEQLLAGWAQNRNIWEGINGYFQNSFQELFRKENRKLWSQIKEAMLA